MASVFVFLFSIVVYGLFWICFGLFIAFVGDLGLWKSAGFPTTGLSTPQAVVMNIGLIVLFGFQHSIMARPWFKRLWQRPRGAAIERSVFVLASVLALGLLMALWQPLGSFVWSLEHEKVRWLLYSLFALGWLLILIATIQIDHWHFFGLRQSFTHFRGDSPAEPCFRERGLYARIRHPIHAGMLLALWSAPDMSQGRLLLASLLTLYVIVGLRLEERNLLQALGDVYRDYRGRIPMLLPGIRSRAVDPSTDGHVPWSLVIGDPVARGRILAALLVLAVAMSTGAAFTLATADETASATRARNDGPVAAHAITHEDLVRDFRVYVPPLAKEAPPLVLVLHGSGGDGNRIRNFVGQSLEPLADQHGFVIAYPDGFEGHWNDCRAAAGYSARLRNVDDVGFLGSLITHLHYSHGIDLNKVFAVGFSNGGQMVYRLAMESPEWFRGLAVIGAGMPTEDNLDCIPEESSVALLVMAGVDDPINPYHGGTVYLNGNNHGGDVRSVVDTARYFAGLCSDCGPEQFMHVWRHADRLQAWYKSKRPWVELHGLERSGHTIPQGRFDFPEFLGATRKDLDAMDIIWRFFRDQLERALPGMERLTKVD
jgi:polyhydroxybutyrate depolymerase